MRDLSAEINVPLEREAPALFRALSPMGRRILFPPDIPPQAAEAKGRRSTGRSARLRMAAGGAVRLPELVSAFGGLSDQDLNQALLCSPIEGIPEVRRRWREWQRRRARLLRRAPPLRRACRW